MKLSRIVRIFQKQNKTCQKINTNSHYIVLNAKAVYNGSGLRIEQVEAEICHEAH